MEHIKRLLNDASDDHDDSKRRKILTTVNELNCSCLEDLSNELLYEIFDFLDYFHVYEAFFNLNIRFRNVLVYSNLPIKIDLSSLSKSTWKRYNADVIETNMDRISTFRITEPFMYDLALTSLGKMLEYGRIETLLLNNIESECLENLLTQLSCSSILSSLVIATVNNVSDKTSICRQIFRLPALKYCKLSLLGGNTYSLLPIATDEYSPIEHLIITDCFYSYQLDRLSSYAPQLRRLSLHLQHCTWQKQTQICPLIFNRLTHIDLELDSMQFDVFEQIISTFFPVIEVLRLTLIVNTGTDPAYINANRWEQLITSHIPHLRIFDIHYRVAANSNLVPSNMERQINQFTTPFWITRQWRFSYQFDDQRYGRRRARFYSTNPYRKKHTLYEQFDTSISLDESNSNFNSVQQIYIQNERSITNCTHFFPNATELYLQVGFSALCASVAILLDRIIPLKQLTKLVIECHHFSFRRILDLLCFAPNIRILIFESMPVYKDDYLLMEQSEIFRRISETNTITHVTLRCECPLEKLKLLVALCPRVQHLSIKTLVRTIEPVTQFLLNKTNPNTRHLFVLSFLRACRLWVERLDNLLRSETLLDDYTLKWTRSELYLWW